LRNNQLVNIGIPHFPVGNVYGIPPVYKNIILPEPQNHNIKLPGADLQRALNYQADYGGCGHWRMIWPEFLLNAYQRAVVSGNTLMIGDKNYYKNIKALKVQRQASSAQVNFLRQIKRDFPELKLIYDIDDVVFKEDIPDYNSSKKAFDDDQIVANILEVMRFANEISVPSQYMKDYYISKTGNKNVTIVPNYIPRFWADRFYNREQVVENYRKHRKKPRIAYAGSGSHFDINNKTNQQDDFSHVIEAVIKTRRDFHWVFLGCYPLGLKPYIDSGEIELVQWSPLMDLPQTLYNLKANLFIAPLQDNTFNRCKSNIKYLEPATLGIPCICQDLITYKDVQYRFSTGDEMIDNIKNVLSSAGKYMNISDAVRKYASTMFLEDHLEEHIELYFKSTNEERLSLMKLNPCITPNPML